MEIFRKASNSNPLERLFVWCTLYNECSCYRSTCWRGLCQSNDGLINLLFFFFFSLVNRIAWTENSFNRLNEIKKQSKKQKKKDPNSPIDWFCTDTYIVNQWPYTVYILHKSINICMAWSAIHHFWHLYTATQIEWSIKLHIFVIEIKAINEPS